jgi:hypothetical protein
LRDNSLADLDDDSLNPEEVYRYMVPESVKYVGFNEVVDLPFHVTALKTFSYIFYYVHLS